MSEVTGVAPDADYALRMHALQGAQIALWDVLQSCERLGSLDASIVRGSEAANDFAAFFMAHPAITQVFFNGVAAEAAFKRHCAPLMRDPTRRFVRLPSTSPAHAALRFEQKRAVWCGALTVKTTTAVVSPPAVA